MIVWHGLERCLPGTPAALALGNFDGVHLGHQAVLQHVQAAARAREARAVLVTFDPHPAEVLAPERRPRLLQTKRQKLAALEEAGVDAVLVLPFDLAMAALSAEEFLERLGTALIPRSIHVGTGFRFGRERQGDVALMRAVGARRGFTVDEVPPVEVDGARVSSSRIREAVLGGRVELARGLLGRPYALEGRVVRGEGRGATLAFPTANLAVENELPPLRGVYVSETVALALRWPSVTNVGVRPTFDGSRLTVESHLIDYEGDLYGERVEARFLARLRDERRFPDPSALADQIARDRAAAVAWFQSLASA
ncbi:MAG TPA: bifunctional riboflavin kinase/FAD synthetase [Candidatus Polarisedimenticolaceae bacterium]|nr:bifunctional riboflavin kinase/FAD synthetase [Candidatus Polarisedimenticolaceae bacterium]